MAKITITIGWPAIHEAARALDQVRMSAPDRPIGYDGIYDAFGGTYYAAEYERTGLEGAVRIATGLKAITQDAWRIIHAADRNVREASMLHESDGVHYVTRYREDGEPIYDDEGRLVQDRRYEEWRVADAADRRRADALARVRAAVGCMLAARPLYDLLVQVGVIADDAERSIAAGVGAEHLNATGLLWLAGAPREDRRVTIAEARTFAAGGEIAV